jgi:hypothetical protein
VIVGVWWARKRWRPKNGDEEKQSEESEIPESGNLQEVVHIDWDRLMNVKIKD